MTYPDFFICGAAKSGTTSLWKYLQQHPSVFMPTSMKEPGYFSNLRPLQDLDRYTSLFEKATDDQRVGEASGAYLTSPESPGRIYDAVPEAQIIIMLRNPADRAYSLYRWMTREGYEPISSFEEALAAEPERIDDESFKHDNPEYYYNFLYFTSGLYSTQIQRFENTFPSERLLYLLFDEFVQKPVDVTQRVFRFLGVDDEVKPTIKTHNKGKNVWSPSLQFSIRHSITPALVNVLGFSLGKRIGGRMMKVNMSREVSPLPPDLRSRLLDRYADDIRKTEEQTGLPLSDAWLE